MLRFIIFTSIFLIFALVELVSYYATSVKIHGTHKITKTKFKRGIVVIFWVFVIIFMAIYIAYINAVMLWCILGAVLNPNKFL